MSDQVQFLRQVQSAQEHTSGIFSDALTSMLAGVEETPLSSLYLNANNTLIRRLMDVQDRSLLEQTVKILYVQALLAGGPPAPGKGTAHDESGAAGPVGTYHQYGRYGGTNLILAQEVTLGWQVK